MNTIVIANAVKQSMTSISLDCRAGRHCEERSDAAIAVTGTLFMVRVRYLAGFGWLASAPLNA